MSDENKNTAENEAPKGKFTRKDIEDMITSAVTKAVSEDTVVKDAVKKEFESLGTTKPEWLLQLGATGRERDVMEKGTKGIAAGRFVRSLAAGRGDPGRAVAWAKKAYKDDLGDVVVKALQAGNFTAAGALVPDAIAAEIIDLLRAKTVMRAAGARTLPMPNGTMTIRKQTGTSTASYVGESTNITSTNPTIGSITLTAKKLAAIVPISNDLLLYDAGNSTAADAFVRDDLVQSISRKEDLSFLRGDGLSDTPKGLRNQMNSANATASAGTTSADIETDLRNLANTLENANVAMVKPVWIMHPSRRNFLQTLRDAVGFLIFPDLRVSNQIYGFPVFTTTAIPTNLGTGAGSEVYLVDMDSCLIGESSQLEIVVDQSASYIEGSTLVSSFSRDETLMRAITRHDFGMRYSEAAAVKTPVYWT